MDQRTMETSFSQISGEQLEAYNSTSRPYIHRDVDVGENLELGRMLHFYTNRELSGLVTIISN